MKSLSLRWGIGLTLIASTLLFFQNCSKFSSNDDSLKSTKASSNPSPDVNDQNNNSSDNNQSSNGNFPDGQTTLTSFNIITKTSPSVGIDCSLSDAVFEYEIKNSPFNVRVCHEYKLATPSRSGEIYSCDADSKFVSPTSSSGWVYDNSSQSWKYLTNLRNHPNYVPGIFRLIVKSTDGSVQSSAPMTIARPGKENCIIDTNTGESVVNPTPVVSGGGSVCTPSSTLTCVDTALPTKPFARVGYRPEANKVYAFKVVAPASGSYTGSASATVQVGSMSAKLLVISETPGDMVIAGKNSSCVAQGTESSRINFSYNNPSANSLVYCKLSAGKTYYINASSGSKYGSGVTCNSASSCAFYFEGR